MTTLRSVSAQASQTAVEKSQDAIDPNGILAAERYGNWPQREREKRGKQK